MSTSAKGSLPRGLSVLVVDDHPLIRHGVRSLLETAVEALQFAEATNAEEAWQRLDAFPPDLIIVDMVLPGIPGTDLIRDLRRGGVRAPILVLSMHGESSYAERALRAGASGYVMKEEVGRVLLEAVARVLDGEIHLEAEMARRIAARTSSAETGARMGPEALTEREFQVWQHLGSGFSTRRIAARLEISPKTVETHCYNIRRKLDIADMTALIHAATRSLHRPREG